jgi:hypothetical protein
MTLLYTPELLLFSVALTQPLPCSECGIYQVSGCYLGICYGKWYWKSQSLGNKVGYMCNGRLEEWICWTYLDTGECQMVEESST